jgi:hypothetical protein
MRLRSLASNRFSDRDSDVFPKYTFNLIAGIIPFMRLENLLGNATTFRIDDLMQMKVVAIFSGNLVAILQE